MEHAGILLAAPGSGSGKTTVTCALLEALKKRKIRVRSFKSGPDYIDPMFHDRVIGVPSRNLDTFFSDGEQIRTLYAYGQEGADFSVIEGAMGIYDGLGGIKKEGSAYHLAQMLDLPIVLVLDANGMGRTMIALLSGLLQYDCDRRIVGVILNRTTGSFCEIIRLQIEEELGLPVLGFFPKQKDLNLESRHLGLKLPDEIADLKRQVAGAAESLEKSVDVPRIVDIAERWQMQKAFRKFANTVAASEEMAGQIEKKQEETVFPRIAVARDEAFCFYYEDNLRLLREAGAELVEFSPLADETLPEKTNGLLLGGGYPELWAKQLAQNEAMRRSVRQAIEAGMPSVAECGGFMYLHEKLVDEQGQSYPMVGVVPGSCRNTGKLVRFGYAEIQERQPHFLADSVIRGHEFHYYDSDNNGQGCIAGKPTTGKKWDCVHLGENHWWGYPHLYYPSNPEFAAHFVKCAAKWSVTGEQRQVKG